MYPHPHDLARENDELFDENDRLHATISKMKRDAERREYEYKLQELRKENERLKRRHRHRRHAPSAHSSHQEPAAPHGEKRRHRRVRRHHEPVHVAHHRVMPRDVDLAQVDVSEFRDMPLIAPVQPMPQSSLQAAWHEMDAPTAAPSFLQTVWQFLTWPFRALWQFFTGEPRKHKPVREVQSNQSGPSVGALSRAYTPSRTSSRASAKPPATHSKPKKTKRPR